MLRIGKLHLKTRLLLAPIAGHCDLPFRLIARRCGGVGLAFTDLICSQAIHRQVNTSLRLAATCEEDAPLGIQLYGKELDIMADAARWAVDQGADVVDINMGCPVDKITKTFAGSKMLCIPDHTVRLVEHLVHTIGHQVPVTAKLRLGFEPDELTAPGLARRLVLAGAQAITIHGRTAAQRFRGQISHEGIAAVVQAVHDAGQGRIPCIGNGDVRTPFDATEMFRLTGCDGVMIGRAALTAPWIFHDTHHRLTTGATPPEPTLRQRLNLFRAHLHLVRQHRDDRATLVAIRHRLAGYAKHWGHCKPLKEALRQVTCPDQIDPILDDFLAALGPEADAVPVTWEDRQAAFA